MKENQTIRTWVETAVSGIRFGPDQQEVKAELLEHIEDKTIDLMRIFPDMEEKEAQERALAGMGDAEELKISLARVHRPWLGYLWRASQVLLAAALVLAVWNGVGIVRIFSSGSADNFVQRRESFQEQFPDSLADPEPDWGEVLAVGAGAGPAEAGGYTFTVRRASLLRIPQPGGDCFYLAFTLRGEGHEPWALPGKDLSDRVQLTDGQGRLYRSMADPDSQGRTQVNCGWSERGLLWREYEGTVFLYLPGEGTTVKDPSEAEGSQVEFDNGVTRFAIPIQWREAVP